LIFVGGATYEVLGFRVELAKMKKAQKQGVVLELTAEERKRQLHHYQEMTAAWYHTNRGLSLDGLNPKEAKEVDHLVMQGEVNEIFKGGKMKSTNKEVHPDTMKELRVLYDKIYGRWKPPNNESYLWMIKGYILEKKA
jgi:hypothetical protein